MEEEKKVPETTETTEPKEEESKNTGVVIAVIAFIVIFIGTIVLGIILAANPDKNGPGVEIVRNMMIILLGLEVIVIGAALTVFLVQIARLVNMLNNEIVPMVKTTQETVQILKGTSEFLSKYLADPVLDANAKAALVTKITRDLGKIGGAVTKKE